jgi:hypothetical protein
MYGWPPPQMPWGSPSPGPGGPGSPWLRPQSYYQGIGNEKEREQGNDGDKSRVSSMAGERGNGHDQEAS